LRNTKMDTKTLNPELLRKLDAYWRAVNYLSVGQIYLYDNPLLKKPLTLAHIKPRLLGHWGTTPGLNFVYVHLNRVINEYDLNVMSITGPGHGGPGLVANAYLEGTLWEKLSVRRTEGRCVRVRWPPGQAPDQCNRH
jgi:xylulose-5-phosphate/fructose-6-phosphate phosphoketolase